MSARWLGWTVVAVLPLALVLTWLHASLVQIVAAWVSVGIYHAVLDHRDAS